MSEAPAESPANTGALLLGELFDLLTPDLSAIESDGRWLGFWEGWSRA